MEAHVPPVSSCASGPLAQLARALASHARGHWFESSTVHYFLYLFVAGTGRVDRRSATHLPLGGRSEWTRRCLGVSGG